MQYKSVTKSLFERTDQKGSCNTWTVHNYSLYRNRGWLYIRGITDTV